jgi:hypothetical protein
LAHAVERPLAQEDPHVVRKASCPAP